MINRAERLLNLCNKFKDRSVLYKEDYYKYSNYCWELAYESGECELSYENSGDNSYYDLVGLKIGEEYACIPVPLLAPTLVAEILKSQPQMVEKYYHERNVDEVSEKEVAWEILIPELVFLSLRKRQFCGDELYIIEKVAAGIVPDNLYTYDGRGCEYMPVYDKIFHKKYAYKGVDFTSWITFEEIFNASK